MARKNVKTDKKKLGVITKDFSWKKIILTVVLGIILGYFFAINNTGQISKEMFFLLIILSLLACTLAILLDIRKILLAK